MVKLILAAIFACFIEIIWKIFFEEKITLFFDKNPDKNPSQILLVSLGVVALAAFYLLFSALKKEFEKANLSQRTSYLDFVFCTSYFLFAILLIDFNLDQKGLTLFCATLICILIIIFFCLEIFTKPLNPKSLSRRFAPNSLSKKDDNIGFAEAAENAIKSILDLKNYVSVVALNGGYGEGKSSYARMIIEAVGAEKSLYSYISLTETNATNDFSKLFAKRWFEALNERYPTINIAPHVASLEAILRESTNHSALVSAISQILVKLNFGLSKTVAKFWDLNALKKEEGKEIFVPNSTAAMFNHIPEIKEDVWIINIDEIERAQLDEIYRVIEVIERFKHEGRFGLPVKLVFLLCVSGSDLQKRLEDLKKIGNEKAQLIEDFFFNNPKSRDQNLFLPPISYQKKREFVINSLNEVLANPSFKIDSIDPAEIKKPTASPENTFLKKADALSFIVKELIKKAPRVTLKVCQELEFFYYHFKDLEGNYAANKLALCDAIGINFIKMEFPWLIADIKVALETGNLILTGKGQKNSDTDSNDAEYYLLAKKLGGIVCSQNFKTPNELEEKAFEERSSNPELMRMVLRGFFDQSKLNEVVEDNFIYKTYSAENHFEALKSLSPDKLKKYAQIDNLPANDFTNSKRLEIIDELINRPLLLKADNINQTNPSSGNFLNLLTKNLEQVAKEFKEKEFREKRNSEDDKEIWSRVKKFLQCEQISTSSKYQFLRNYIEENAGNISNMLNLKCLFQKEEVKEVFKHVFIEAANRYFKGENPKSIYQEEEMPIDVLYHSWNGEKEPSQNIQRINQATVREMSHHPEFISLLDKRRRYDAKKPNFIVSLNQIRDAAKESLKTLEQKHPNKFLLESVAATPPSFQNTDDQFCNYDFNSSINPIKPLMMAMIQEGYIDESVSFFAD